MMHKPGWRGLLIVGGVILSLLLFALVFRARADFVRIPTRLSRSTDVCDIEPRAAISADGQWLAAAWIRGKQINQGCVSRGEAVVRWANEGSSLSGWSPVTTLPLPSGACAVHVDVALAGTTAHLAVSLWNPCDAVDANSSLRYYMCDLVGGGCNFVSEAVSQSGTADRRFSDVRIALDSTVEPHLVYATGTHGMVAGDIYYVRKTSTGWTAPYLISTGEKINGFYRPVIVASNGRMHFAWERHRDYIDPQNRYRMRGDVQYRYCDEAGSCVAPITYSYPDAQLVDKTYPIPGLIARGNRVFLTWNVCADVNPDPPCQRFYLLYARSDANGQSMQHPKEIGTETSISQLNQSLQTYAGVDGQNSLSEYATYARPMAALDSQLNPYVAWQVRVGSGYVISTTYASASTSSTFSWEFPGNWQSGSGYDGRLSPTVLLPETPQPPDGVHMFYMRAWTVEIAGQTLSRSQVYYEFLDFFGDWSAYDLDMDIHARTSQLPEERARPVSAFIMDEQSNPLPGLKLNFSTDLGSFDPTGYGPQQTFAYTDPDGWARVTAYTNLTGTATIRVWLDMDQDNVWDFDEPTDTLAQTWVFQHTPALAIADTQVLAGTLMTTTMRYHPYGDDYGPINYVLWWCPDTGASPPLPQLAVGPVRVDRDTWGLPDVLVRAPTGTVGPYHLESHWDTGSYTACTDDDTYRLARSGPIQIYSTTQLPPGPVLLVSNDMPRPGGGFVATLKQHAPTGGGEFYSVWWCPLPGARQVSALLKTNIVVSASGEQAVSVVTPYNVSGLYRLESHFGTGSCGASATLRAKSSLLSPLRVTFLPLVLRNKR